ncbi:hypothetical protein ACHAPJ_000410 [Fusarium lateritium]
MEDIKRDSNATRSRPAKAIVRRSADLTLWKRYELRDLVRAWVRIKYRKNGDFSKEPISAE